MMRLRSTASLEAERALQLFERLAPHFDVHQQVVRLVDLGHRVGKLPAAPILGAMDHPAAPFDQGAVTLDHAGHLIALIGVNHEYDFVMSHAVSFRLQASAYKA